MRKHPERIPSYLDSISIFSAKIESYVENLDEAAFVESRMVQDAVVWNLNRIQDMRARILISDPDFDAKHPDFRLRHSDELGDDGTGGYEPVSARLVWRTIVDQLPELKWATAEIKASST